MVKISPNAAVSIRPDPTDCGDAPALCAFSERRLDVLVKPETPMKTGPGLHSINMTYCVYCLTEASGVTCEQVDVTAGG